MEQTDFPENERLWIPSTKTYFQSRFYRNSDGVYLKIDGNFVLIRSKKDEEYESLPPRSSERLFREIFPASEKVEEAYVDAGKIQLEFVRREILPRYAVAPVEGRLSIDDGIAIVKQACSLLTEYNEGPIFVGVAGLSGSGKTVFTEKLLNSMPYSAVISMDNYYKPEKIAYGNFDYQTRRDMIDYDTLMLNIRGLRTGCAVEGPIYDFKSNSCTGYRTIEVPRSGVVVIEGIYAVHESMGELIDVGVTIIGGVYFELSKWISKDIRSPRKKTEEIFRQLDELSAPMDKLSLDLGLQRASIKIRNSFSPFYGVQPTHILKSTRIVTMDEIKSVISEEYDETTEEFYDMYLLLPFEDPESPPSYLRIRIIDGKYIVMFEEWVIDGPFIRSPRITFVVGARFLDGLIAMGFTIAAILKRSSSKIFNKRVCIKLDWLEQLDRGYIQVQGEDQLYVRDIANQLGLDGSFVSLTYIQQIQLEKRLNDVIALPEALKGMLDIDYADFASSPKETITQAIADRRTKYVARDEMIDDLDEF